MAIALQLNFALGLKKPHYFTDQINDRPYGIPFDENDLVAHIRPAGRNYIIQGQQVCSFANHTKPHSLDYWLRENFANNRDTKQAENSVLDALVFTGLFTFVARLPCPDSGVRCKGIRLV